MILTYVHKFTGAILAIELSNDAVPVLPALVRKPEEWQVIQ